MTSRLSLPVLPDPDSERRRLARALSARIEGDVRFAAHDRMLYATDASIYQVEPVGVVIPRTVEDVVATVRFCADEDLALLPRGGGTSLAGQTVNQAVVVDFSPHQAGLIAVNPEAKTARVQPGLVLDHLNAATAEHGLMFGPDVATSTHATLGGMIGNNSAGAHSILYGRTVEHVEAMDVVLADGHRVHLERGGAQQGGVVADVTRRVAEVVLPLASEIDARFPKTRRRVNGYNLDLVLADLRASTPGTFDQVNLARLFCGSEGTLGVTLEATVGLVPAPRVKGLAIVAFAGVDAALEAVGDVLETAPAAVELIDEVIIGLARANLEYRVYADLLPRPGGREAGAVLYVEYFDDDAAGLDERLRSLEGRYGSECVQRYSDAESMTRAWKLRKAGEPLLHGQLGARKPITFIEDTAVEPARLPEFVRRFRAIVEAHGTTASYYAHASVGCLHIRPMIALGDSADVRAMQKIVAEVTELVIEFGGALSGEHGDGRLRTHLLERFYGPAICNGFREIKAIFDPAGRMNPGNIVGAPSMTAHLRSGGADRPLVVPPVRTYFRFANEHGFGEAVERCNGAGVCRKTSGGTMCPSYRATRDERHATRGRGNALRLAITGQRGGVSSVDPLWSDPETLETLDLCLSCKACKSECPSNVDIARLKAEYLAQSYDQDGVPRQARAFGRVRDLNRAGARVPGLANFLMRSRTARLVLDGLLGLDSRRSLPPFAPALDRWHRARPRSNPDAPAVVLFPDCFTMYNEPAIGQSAIRVLETLGYRVVLPEVGCCGRAMISNGLLAEARDTCLETADALCAAVEANDAEAVVFCEPSCLSAVTDDWLDLDMGVDLEMLGSLAGRSVAVEAFVEQGWTDHPRTPDIATPEGSVLLHGHCHQKALGGSDATAAALARVARDVTTLDSGCCGMAGSFGFTRDHYDVSLRIAELALFPALRENAEAIVVAPGTSCRHQILDGLGREALHPIEFLERALSR